MTLSPLVVLILLIFVMVIAAVFLIWSIFNLKPARANQSQDTTAKRAHTTKTSSTQTFRKQTDDAQKEAKRVSNDHNRGLRVSPPPVPVPTPVPVEAKITKKHEPKVAKLTVQETKPNPQEALEPTLINASLSESPKVKRPVFQDTKAAKLLFKSEPKPMRDFTDDAALRDSAKSEPSPRKFEVIASDPVVPEVPPMKPKTPTFVVVDTAVSKRAKTASDDKKSSETKDKKADFDEDAFDRFISSKNEDLNF